MTADAQPHNVAIIRDLRLAAFTPEELRRFCYDRLTSHPIVDTFGPGYGLNDMVDEVITYCERHLLFDELLTEVRQVNPRQYDRFAPRLRVAGKGPASHAPPALDPFPPAGPPRFAKCERDLEDLGRQLGASHWRYGEYQRLRDDLENNIAGACYDDTEEVRARRTLILQALNRLALNTLKQGFGEGGFARPPSRIKVILLNLIVGFVVALVLGPRVAAWLPCQSPWAVGFGSSVVVLSLVHVIWRLACSRPPELKRRPKVNLRLIEFELDFAPWLDTLHPWTLPDWGLVLGLGLALAASVLLISVMPYSGDSMPMVESYTVRYVASGETILLALDKATEEGIQLQPGQSIVITTEMMDDVDVHCTWHANFGGRVIPEQECTARYTAPYRATDDVISILIESRCRTCETRANVYVRVGHP